jgi:hypothetical protein
MLKHPDDPRKEPARKRAERRWRNHDVEKRFKEEKKKASAAPKEPKELEIADVIVTDAIKNGQVTRATTKSGKDIREMMEGNVRRNIGIYLYVLEAKKKRLLLEKLRRLRAAQEAQT